MPEGPMTRPSRIFMNLTVPNLSVIFFCPLAFTPPSEITVRAICLVVLCVGNLPVSSMPPGWALLGPLRTPPGVPDFRTVVGMELALHL